MNKASQVLVNLVKIKKKTMDDGKKKTPGTRRFLFNGSLSITKSGLLVAFRSLDSTGNMSI